MPDMRFAPPRRIRIADRIDGLNQVRVRSHNEKLVLTLMLQHQSLSRVEMCERTGLSAQAVSVIVRSLEQEGLLSRGEARRGRVGPPTIPMSLNPEGAYAIGISVGRRQTEAVLIDFVGTVRHLEVFRYARLDAADCRRRLPGMIARALQALAPAQHDRVAGIGLSLPEDEGSDAPGESIVAGGDVSGIDGTNGFEVFLHNDITAAARGEMTYGAAKTLDDFLYCYVGSHIRKRLILNHRVHNGRGFRRLGNHGGGVLDLERALERRGAGPGALWDSPPRWDKADPAVRDWVAHCVIELEDAAGAIMEFVDLRKIVIASLVPPDLREAICRKLEAQLTTVEVLSSGIDTACKAIGAASLPLHSRFLLG